MNCQTSQILFVLWKLLVRWQFFFVQKIFWWFIFSQQEGNVHACASRLISPKAGILWKPVHLLVLRQCGVVLMGCGPWQAVRGGGCSLGGRGVFTQQWLWLERLQKATLAYSLCGLKSQGILIDQRESCPPPQKKKTETGHWFLQWWKTWSGIKLIGRGFRFSLRSTTGF